MTMHPAGLRRPVALSATVEPLSPSGPEPENGSADLKQLRTDSRAALKIVSTVTTTSPGPTSTDEGEGVASRTLSILERAPSSAMNVLEIRRKFDEAEQPDVKKVVNY